LKSLRFEEFGVWSLKGLGLAGESIYISMF
jgi:hypothetical protein